MGIGVFVGACVGCSVGEGVGVGVGLGVGVGAAAEDELLKPLLVVEKRTHAPAPSMLLPADCPVPGAATLLPASPYPT